MNMEVLLMIANRSSGWETTHWPVLGMTKSQRISALISKGELGVLDKLANLNSVLLDLAEKHVETIMPGYTHLQHAQPISFAHHLMAYYNVSK